MQNNANSELPLDSGRDIKAALILYPEDLTQLAVLSPEDLAAVVESLTAWLADEGGEYAVPQSNPAKRVFKAIAAKHARHVAKYRGKKEGARSAANHRWQKAKADATAMRTHSECNADAYRPQCDRNASNTNTNTNTNKAASKPAALKAILATLAEEYAHGRTTEQAAAVRRLISLAGLPPKTSSRLCGLENSGWEGVNDPLGYTRTIIDEVVKAQIVPEREDTYAMRARIDKAKAARKAAEEAANAGGEA